MPKKAAKKQAAPKKKAAAKKKSPAMKQPAPKKKAPARKAASAKKTASAKKAASAKKTTPAKKTASAKRATSPKKATAAKKKASAKGKVAKSSANGSSATPAKQEPQKPVKMTAFLIKQNQRLLHLRDSLVDAMTGMAQDNLRGSANGGDNSAFGMHQADAGSDSYDRDFALNLLSKEQDALYEIDEALKRVQNGTYGICEMSGKKIMKARLEAIPFTRLTVECQAQVEREMGGRANRRARGSNFGLTITGKEPDEKSKDFLEDD